MFGTNNKFKPRYDKGVSGFPFAGRVYSFKKNPVSLLVVGAVVLWLFYNSMSALGGLVFSSRYVSAYTPEHPLTSPFTIETNSKYIYPPIEDAPLLKELTVHSLVKEAKVRDANFPEIEKNVIRSLNEFDDPNPVLQKIKEDEENSMSDLQKAKNYFKNQDKIVYRPKKNNLRNYPKVVIVTAIDFEKYSLDGLAKIVQNRVDYAHEHNYGIYVRWYQEFLPGLNSMTFITSKEKSKWIRLTIMRAAIFAFPHAEWFWYIDQDGLIMDLSIDIQKFMLNTNSLGPIMKKEQSIIPPDGAIKTYKNAKPENVKLIVTQSDSKIETHSFILRNDVVGKSILEFWYDNLYLTYPNFPYGPDSAITHILQWHPFILSKTSIVPSRTIAARHPLVQKGVPINALFDYHTGDFTAHWTDCVDGQCEEILSQYHTILKGGKS